MELKEFAIKIRVKVHPEEGPSWKQVFDGLLEMYNRMGWPIISAVEIHPAEEEDDEWLGHH